MRKNSPENTHVGQVKGQNAPIQYGYYLLSAERVPHDPRTSVEGIGPDRKVRGSVIRPCNLVENIPDLKLSDMILFAVKCARDLQSLAQGDYDKLLLHGLREAEIVEIIGMAALAVYANIIADATAMTEDEVFSEL